MAISSLTVENFKSFGRLDVDLTSFNAVVGSNASGKSNFVQIFEFLRVIQAHGLEFAFALHGGTRVIRNFNLPNDALLHFRVETDDAPQFAVEREKSSTIGFKMERPVYDFSIRFHKRGDGYRVVHDEISQKFSIDELEAVEDETDSLTFRRIPTFLAWQAGTERQYRAIRQIGEGSLSYRRRSSNNMTFSVQLPTDALLDKEDLFPFTHIPRLPQRPNALILESPLIRVSTGWLFRAFDQVVIYDIDSKRSKLAIPITGATPLDKDGGNLAIVLRELLKKPAKKAQFLNLLSDLLPFLSNVVVEISTGGSLLTRLTESHTREAHDLYATWASDGTMSILALIVALYFDNRALAIFEESERNIHPHLIGKIIQMMKEASARKQIILTTHNPEMLRHIQLDEILLVSRASDGCSEISRPANSDVVKVFLDNELGIEDLFVDNLLAL